jgi:hypothetical protein
MTDTTETIVESPQGFKKIGTLTSDFMTQKIKVPVEALEEGKKIVLTSRTGKDIYIIEQEFIAYANQTPPKNIYGAFIGFVKSKVKTG